MSDINDMLIFRINKRMAQCKTNATTVAAVAGLGKTSVRDILARKSKTPTVDTIARIASALKCSVSYLLGEDEIADVPTEEISASDQGPPQTIVAQRLAKAIAEKQENPSSVSLAANLSRSAVRDILSGKAANPGIYTVKAIAEVLGCSVAHLIGEDAAIQPDEPIGKSLIGIYFIRDSGEFFIPGKIIAEVKDGVYLVETYGPTDPDIARPMEIMSIEDMLGVSDVGSPLMSLFRTKEDLDAWVRWLETPDKPNVINLVKPTK